MGVILGPDGKPLRPPRTFITPEWLWREVSDLLDKPLAFATEMRIQDLRESVEKGR